MMTNIERITVIQQHAFSIAKWDSTDVLDIYNEEKCLLFSCIHYLFIIFLSALFYFDFTL